MARCASSNALSVSPLIPYMATCWSNRSLCCFLLAYSYILRRIKTHTSSRFCSSCLDTSDPVGFLQYERQSKANNSEYCASNHLHPSRAITICVPKSQAYPAWRGRLDHLSSSGKSLNFLVELYLGTYRSGAVTHNWRHARCPSR